MVDIVGNAGNIKLNATWAKDGEIKYVMYHTADMIKVEGKSLQEVEAKFREAAKSHPQKKADFEAYEKLKKPAK